MAYKALRRATLAALLAAAGSNATTSTATSSRVSDSGDTTDSPTPSPHLSEYMTASPTSMMMPGGGNTTAVNGTDTPSPNMPIPKPECDANQTVSVRYSATTGRLYLEAAVVGERGGCVTIDQIWTARGGGTKTGAKAPLYAVDPMTGAVSENITGTWLLEEDLYVEDGITLKVRRLAWPASFGVSNLVPAVFPHGCTLSFFASSCSFRILSVCIRFQGATACHTHGRFAQIATCLLSFIYTSVYIYIRGAILSFCVTR